MIKSKKIINYVSWIIIIIMGIMLFANWSTIPYSVITHTGMGQVSFGDKTSLIAILLIEVLINVVFTLKYDVPFIRDLRKMKQPSFLIDIISIVLQSIAVVVMSSFIIAALNFQGL